MEAMRHLMKLRNIHEYVLSGPTFPFYRWHLSAFQLCACVGLATGVAINIGLGTQLNLPLTTCVVISLLGLFMIPIVAMATKIITGEEQLCFYHHLITVLAVTAITLRLLGQPILSFLDIMALAIGTARAIGYFGCLMAGCCHGHPCRWGVVYHKQYEDLLPQALLGTPLFPIQIVESFWTLGVVIVGCSLLLKPHVSGAGFAWFIATYCPARFCFEFARWPPNYQFRSGLSQHQWVSVVLLLFITVLEVTGILPFQLWHGVVLVVMLMVSTVSGLKRVLRGAACPVNHPEHIRELTAAIDVASRSSEFVTNGQQKTRVASIPIGNTSLGLQISVGKIASEEEVVYHYALSSRSGLTEATANSVAEAIIKLHLVSGPTEILAGRHGVYHLLVHSARSGAL
jgi:hypothetical protein